MSGHGVCGLGRRHPDARRDLDVGGVRVITVFVLQLINGVSSKVAALVSGVLFGLGLTLSECRPAKVQIPQHHRRLGPGPLVMGGAVVVTVLLTPLVLKRAAPYGQTAFCH